MKRRHTYTGYPVPWFLPLAFYEGWTDMRICGLLKVEQLYSKRPVKRMLWWFGALLGRTWPGYVPRTQRSKGWKIGDYR